MGIAEQIFNLFEANGQDAYFGENVSQLEHALQAAYLAQEADAGAELVVAALLHDVGHLLHGFGETIAEEGLDAKHEMVGDAWLTRYFPPSVTEPARLHVTAKRYLCSTDKDYLAQLSPASQLSFRLQGGMMSRQEASEFESSPYYRDAIQLRYWDDEAKTPDLETPDIEHYRAAIEAVARKSEPEGAA